MTLDPPSSTQELPAYLFLDEDYLILSTIHSAKGLEWDSVYVIHASDGNIPSDINGRPEEIEEERRLFYVAMTRAKNHLNVVRPERYYFHNRRESDQHLLNKIMRFFRPLRSRPCLPIASRRVCTHGFRRRWNETVQSGLIQSEGVRDLEENLKALGLRIRGCWLSRTRISLI